jgi:hypothetical protein
MIGHLELEAGSLPGTRHLDAAALRRSVMASPTSPATTRSRPGRVEVEPAFATGGLLATMRIAFPGPAGAGSRSRDRSPAQPQPVSVMKEALLHV